MFEDIDFQPPSSVAKAAARGLELRKKHGKGGLTPKQASKQGIGSGVTRAATLKNRKNVSPKVIKQMVAFFNRHEKNKAGGEDDAGYISWQLWGGDAGRSWANKIKRQMDSAEKSKKESRMSKAAELIEEIINEAEKIPGWLARAAKMTGGKVGTVSKGDVDVTFETEKKSENFIKRIEGREDLEISSTMKGDKHVVNVDWSAEMEGKGPGK